MQLVLIVLVVLVLLPGVLFRPSSVGFFSGRKAAGPVLIGASLLATCLGASGTMGVISRAYGAGWSAFWWLGSGSVGLVLLGLVWAPRMRARPGTVTLPQWVGHSYGAPARSLSAVLIALMWLGVIAAQWTAAGALLSSLTGWPVQYGIALSAVVVSTYTAWGGQQAVLRTDGWQLLLIAVALLLLLGALLLPGWPAVAPGTEVQVWSEYFVPQGQSLVCWPALMVVVGGMYVVGPDLCSRVLMARDDRSARLGAVWAGVGLALASLALVLVGVLLRQSGAGPAEARQALPWLLVESGRLPVALSAVVGAGLVAAMWSSADTCLLTAACVVELDLVRPHMGEDEISTRAGRVFVCLAGLLSCGIAALRPQIIPNLLLAYSFYSGGLLLPLLLLGFPRCAARVDRRFVWAAMVVGGLAPIVLRFSMQTPLPSELAGALGVLSSGVLLGLGAAVGSMPRAV